ncbi:hypothetical protein H4R34_003713 [Dimargaris verticillata]|uniref:Uncharacterized protein n=1 Tax=Dimargaris verticillata TaxID=2761393 RepID=A0A9W8B408_9FUNG|nr:hypothetical protein H4R34_003713 [Dimargaris verticillata]
MAHQLITPTGYDVFEPSEEIFYFTLVEKPGAFWLTDDGLACGEGLRGDLFNSELVDDIPYFMSKGQYLVVGGDNNLVLSETRPVHPDNIVQIHLDEQYSSMFALSRGDGVSFASCAWAAGSPKSVVRFDTVRANATLFHMMNILWM